MTNGFCCGSTSPSGEITASLKEYQFSEATTALYRFFWSEFCDWYLEASKAILQGNDQAAKANTLAVIDFILSNTLRLFHPFLPFVTEELWHGMGFHQDLPEDQGGKSIMFARWPKPLDEQFKEHYGLDESDERFASAKYELVTQGRNFRREYNIPSSKKLEFHLLPSGNIPSSELEVIRLLLNASEVRLIDKTFQSPKGTPSAQTPLGNLYLPLEGHIDKEAEKARLEKELAKIKAEIDKVQVKLNNPNFAQKVPKEVLEEHQKRLADWQSKLAQGQKNILDLS